MDVRKMKKDDLELMSNKDITFNLLENSKKTINTADLFNEILKLLELPSSEFDKKIGDYYTSLTIDKRFVLLDDAKWDLRKNHAVELKVEDDEEEENEEEIENNEEEEETDEDIETAIDDEDIDTDDDLDDLSVLSDDDIEEEN